MCGGQPHQAGRTREPWLVRGRGVGCSVSFLLVRCLLTGRVGVGGTVGGLRALSLSCRQEDSGPRFTADGHSLVRWHHVRRSPPPAVELTSAHAPSWALPSHRAGALRARMAVHTVEGRGVHRPAQGPRPPLSSCLGTEAGPAALPAGAPLGRRHACGAGMDPFRTEQQGPDGVCRQPAPVCTARTCGHRADSGPAWPALHVVLRGPFSAASRVAAAALSGLQALVWPCRLPLGSVAPRG